MKIQTFRDLITWQKAHEAVLSIYNITEQFPDKEKFGLTSQMRRAAISMTSNIAEGFSRQSLKEKIQFYHITLGSNTELQNQILVAKDLKYIDSGISDEVLFKLIEVNKLANGLIKSLRMS